MMQRDLGSFSRVFFLGIGGIGMSALARWFVAQGLSVWGYDRVHTPLTNRLEGEGIVVLFQDSPERLPEEWQRPEEVLVVRTPAVPLGNKFPQFFQEKGFTVMKRAQALGLLTQGLPTLAVAGTHGKTTTTAIASWLMHNTLRDGVGFVGGLLSNTRSNLILPKDGEPPRRAVVEADEFDRSFLTLFPEIAVLTSADADHLDIYEKPETLLENYAAFLSQVKPEGELLVAAHVSEAVLTRLPVGFIPKFYAFKGFLPPVEGRVLDFWGENFCIQEGKISFDFCTKEGERQTFYLPLPGRHNAENAVAAIAALHLWGVPLASLAAALENFGGIHRRFEIYMNTKAHVLIDDYAHHPSEIRATLKAAKELFADRRLTVIFQPHLYSRTRDFHMEFADSLGVADEVVLLDIYPAREEPLAGINSGIILENVINEHKFWLKDKELLSFVQEKRPEFLVVLGAGDIDRFPAKIKEVLST